MNRQQRRLIARQRDFENRYWKEIMDRQNRVDDRKLEIDMVCLALALHELYGWQWHGIQRVLQEFNRQILRLGEGVTYEELTAELEKETGVQIRLTDKEEV